MKTINPYKELLKFYKKIPLIEKKSRLILFNKKKSLEAGFKFILGFFHASLCLIHFIAPKASAEGACILREMGFCYCSVTVTVTVTLTVTVTVMMV